MPGQAQITSVEALSTFRSDLIVYLGQMKPAIDEVRNELGRTKYWLQVEQRRFWETQLRLRRRQLEEAQAELFNAKLSSLQTSSTLQGMAVQKAQRAVHEAEQKVACLKRWDRDLENLTDPLAQQVEQLQGFLTSDMGKAVAYLTQIVQALDAYKSTLATGPDPAPELLPDPDKTS